MIAKEFIGPRRLIHDSFRLARKVYDSGFHPEVLIAIWRGGTPVGIVVHEFLTYKGMRPFHTAVKVESYVGIGRKVAPRIVHLEPVLKAIRPGAPVLIVDDIIDSGETVRALKRRIAARTANVKVAALYCKAGRTSTDDAPDFVVRRTKKWIVFPHELLHLSKDEIKTKSRYIHRLLA